MDGSLIYAKTPKGIAEVAARSAELSMVVRRVLIMMDGKRTVDDLSVYVRPGEIDAIVTQLESAGLAEKAGEAFRTTTTPPSSEQRTGPPTAAPAVPAASAVPAVPVAEEPEFTPITLEDVKRRAVRELNERLGPEGDAMAMRIEACRSIDEFRERVREAERYVAGALGPAAAQDYLRALRRRP